MHYQKTAILWVQIVTWWWPYDVIKALIIMILFDNVQIIINDDKLVLIDNTGCLIKVLVVQSKYCTLVVIRIYNVTLMTNQNMIFCKPSIIYIMIFYKKNLRLFGRHYWCSKRLDYY